MLRLKILFSEHPRCQCRRDGVPYQLQLFLWASNAKPLQVNFILSNSEREKSVFSGLIGFGKSKSISLWQHGQVYALISANLPPQPHVAAFILESL